MPDRSPTRPNVDTVYREGDRIRASTGTGYADMVSDTDIRRHITRERESLDNAFAEAVLAIRRYERLANR